MRPAISSGRGRSSPSPCSRGGSEPLDVLDVTRRGLRSRARGWRAEPTIGTGDVLSRLPRTSRSACEWRSRRSRQWSTGLRCAGESRPLLSDQTTSSMKPRSSATFSAVGGGRCRRGAHRALAREPGAPAAHGPSPCSGARRGRSVDPRQPPRGRRLELGGIGRPRVGLVCEELLDEDPGQNQPRRPEADFWGKVRRLATNAQACERAA